MPMTGPSRPAGLSLQQARLCLDCDCLTVAQRCPWCDRSGTVPLAGWFRPIEDRKADAARHTGPDAVTAPRWLLIVDHHQRELYRVLRRALAGTGVEVLYERRVGQRRRVAAGPAAEEQRRTERRRPRAGAAVYPDSGARPESAPPRPSGDRAPAEVVRSRRRQPAPA